MNVMFRNSHKIEKDDVFIKEVNDSLQTLKESNLYLKRLVYFLRLSQKFYDEDRLLHANPEVIVLGTSIPEEIIYAAGARPFWVLGGSLGTSMWADSFVPRDTDAISQSILGFLKNEYFDLGKNATVIIPITCDSMRKIAYMLNKEVNVITIDIPPNKYSEDSARKYVSQMWRVCEKIQEITKKRISFEEFDNAVNIVNAARYESRRFIDNCKNNGSIISGVLSMYILNTYYLTDDINEWTRQLGALNDELEDSACRWKIEPQDKPNILLMGSPIYFPNYKIPFLLNDINLNIVSYVSVDSQKIYTNSNSYGAKNSFWEYFSSVVLENYYCDCSAAYVDNYTLFDNVMTRELEYKIDGVIYHVLKGQIEYDFELTRYEEFFNSKGIPVFRLETDYNYHDIEQIRIRVEAFSEMLVQNLYRNARAV